MLSYSEVTLAGALVGVLVASISGHLLGPRGYATSLSAPGVSGMIAFLVAGGWFMALFGAAGALFGVGSTATVHAWWTRRVRGETAGTPIRWPSLAIGFGAVIVLLTGSHRMSVDANEVVDIHAKSVDDFWQGAQSKAPSEMRSIVDVYARCRSEVKPSLVNVGILANSVSVCRSQARDESTRNGVAPEVAMAAIEEIERLPRLDSVAEAQLARIEARWSFGHQ